MLPFFRHFQELPVTRINYPDLVRTSPDGQLRLEIRSPDNAPKPRAPLNSSQANWGGFQCDFVYSVTRIATGEVLWKYCPAEDDRLFGPADAWISNGAQVVISTCNPGMSDLFLLEATGKTFRVYDVLQELLEGNEEEIHWTSAGSHWDHRGHGLFFEIDASHYWCFRTEMNRQIVIDLDIGVLVTLAGAIQQAVEKAQRCWAMQTLNAAADDRRLKGDPFADHDVHFLFEIETALLWCGTDRIRESIPLLQGLESVQICGGYSSGWRTSDGSATDVVSLMIVRTVQFALRRMSVEPAGYASAWLFRCNDELKTDEDTDEQFQAENRIALPEQLSNRTDRLKQIEFGMSKRQVAELVGMPDVEYYDQCRGRLWEYDVLQSDDGPYTFSIQWDYQPDNDSETAKEILRTPPGWENWKPRIHGL